MGPDEPAVGCLHAWDFRYHGGSPWGGVNAATGAAREDADDGATVNYFLSGLPTFASSD